MSGALALDVISSGDNVSTTTMSSLSHQHTSDEPSDYGSGPSDPFVDTMRAINPWHSGAFFISVSFYLFLATSFYCHRVRSDPLWVTSVVCCLDSFLLLLECLVIFLRAAKYAFLSEPRTGFQVTVWLIYSCLNTSTFVLFWLQRGDFYRRTAVVNTTSRLVKYAENLLLGVLVGSELVRSFIIVWRGADRPPDRYCDIGMETTTAAVFSFASTFYKVTLTVLMLQPIVTNWARLRSSSSNRFNFRLRREVIRPALSSCFYMFVSGLYIYPYVLYRRNTNCDDFLAVFLMMIQAIPLIFIVTILFSLENYRHRLFPFCSAPLRRNERLASVTSYRSSSSGRSSRSLPSHNPYPLAMVPRDV